MTLTTSPTKQAWDVVSAAAAQVGVNPYAVMSDIRTDDVALARHVAMYVLRKRYYLTYPKIGQLLGRDHSTVMYGCNRIRVAMPSASRISWVVSGTVARLNRKVLAS